MRVNNAEITVLITFYNQEKYVDQALESVFMQETSFEFKVVVGDDGSTDGTIEKVKKWIEKYPDRIDLRVQEREDGVKYVRGSRASRNRLNILKCVDTPYFIYLDGDDYWTDKKKLQKQYDVLEKKENIDCVGCAHYICVFHEDKPDERDYLPFKNTRVGRYYLKKYWRTQYFHTDTILFRSDHIKDLKMDLILDSFNDNIITYCFLQFGPLYFIDECMVDYRQNVQSIYANERRDINLIRDFLSYDVECQINSNMQKINAMRHVGNLLEYSNNHDMFDCIGEEYLEIAKKYNFTTTIRVLETKHLFSDDWNKDAKLLKQIRFEGLIRKVFDNPINALKIALKRIVR